MCCVCVCECVSVCFCVCVCVCACVCVCECECEETGVQCLGGVCVCVFFRREEERKGMLGRCGVEGLRRGTALNVCANYSEHSVDPAPNVPRTPEETSASARSHTHTHTHTHQHTHTHTPTHTHTVIIAHACPPPVQLRWTCMLNVSLHHSPL